MILRLLKCIGNTIIVTNDKNILTRRKESDTYLATVSRHCWSQQIANKIDKM